ncbi:MAG: hypothetical protein RIS10_1013 [Pseudomonadota bacterium]
MLIIKGKSFFVRKTCLAVISVFLISAKVMAVDVSLTPDNETVLTVKSPKDTKNSKVADKATESTKNDPKPVQVALPVTVVEAKSSKNTKTSKDADKAAESKKKDPKPLQVARPAHPVDLFELPDINIVSNTPVGNTGLELKKIPGNVQAVEDEEIHRHEAFSLSDFMNRRLESVNLNDVQNNPYQPNITYRGFEASPLLGTPIGISVFQDGVRINEPFGDTVNWDLIPQIAIASMEMVPGSNPVFGLNTLGGALSVRTKSGVSHPGYHMQASGGSYGRQNYEAEIGGSKGNFDWYVAGNIFEDNGWRPYSPTSVNQAFGKVGWENERTDLDLSFTFADNNLQGVGPTPENMLQQNWTSIYTAPDITEHTMYFVNLKGAHFITDKLQLSGNAYNRNNRSYSSNGNTNEECAEDFTLTTCEDADGNIIDSGSIGSSLTQENGTGVNLQMTSDYKVINHDNQLTVGGGYNYGNTNFTAGEQNAVFNESQYENATEPVETTVSINGQNTYSNVFATNTFSVFDWLHTNASMNWMHANVQTTDKMGTALNGNNTYARVNPSAGLTFNPLDAFSLDTPLKELTTYFNYNEGFRVPTALELSCADETAPCSLPNSFVSDPPLKAVVSHTYEVGARGNFNEALKWNFALYQTQTTNDILFISSTNPTTGYFQNVGATQRQGAEFGMSGLVFESLNWYVSYGFVDATYQTTEELSNGLQDGSTNLVTPGKRMPSIPQNTFKFGSEYEVFRNGFFGGDLQYVSSQYARGDDQNQYAQISGYAVINLNARYVVTKNIELYAMGRNIFDNHYASFGQIGQNAFQDDALTTFKGPGAPATGYAGVRIHWD